MRDNIKIYKVHVRLLLLLVVMLLTACSDDSESVDENRDLVQLVPYTRIMTEISPATRAINFSDKYSKYFGPNSIGVYAVTKDEAPSDVRSFSYINGTWISYVSVLETVQYYFYGYMPVRDDVRCRISKRPESTEETGYSIGAVLSFFSVPPVLGEDFAVITGVLPLPSADPEGEFTLQKRQFSYVGQPVGSNFVCLMLDHLYASVQFNFLVNETYNELRTIKLTKVELKTTDSHYYPFEVTLKTEADYTVSWGEPGDRTNVFEPLFTTEEGVELSADVATVVNGYFVPNADVADNLELKCTYDVYDKENNKIRENCVAVNKLPANMMRAEVNQCTVLTLTVNPTYLYVLSDPDLDNPTVTLN